MHRIIFATLLALTVSVRVLGFGHEGHQAIAEIAKHHLTPTARAEIIRILGNDDLAAVATWLDDVRNAARHHGENKGNEEAQAFVRIFPDSASWHFTNFPAGSARYDDTSPFASGNDIVHALGLAIDTLEGRSSKMSKGDALKVLVHLVADIHQPLHAVTGFYDVTNHESPRLLSPAEAAPGSPMDAGGNAVFYAKNQSLHELWDTTLLHEISKDRNFHTLATLVERQHGHEHQATSGDYHQWPAVWATESIALGTNAYAGILFRAASFTPARGRAIKLHRIEAELPANYVTVNTEVASRQLASAGARLADLLNSLQFAQ